jgi:hypothetical protein
MLAGEATAVFVAAREFVVPDVLASADDATKPMEASDNVNASNFFMIFSLFSKIYGRDRHASITCGKESCPAM